MLQAVVQVLRVAASAQALIPAHAHGVVRSIPLSTSMPSLCHPPAPVELLTAAQAEHCPDMWVPIPSPCCQTGATVTVVKEGPDLWRPKMTPWKRQILTQLNLMGDKPNLQVGCAQGVEGLLPLLPRVEL